jgi:hypothetical protein
MYLIRRFLPSDGIYNGIDLVKFKAGAFLYVLHYLLVFVAPLVARAKLKIIASLYVP